MEMKINDQIIKAGNQLLIDGDRFKVIEVTSTVTAILQDEDLQEEEVYIFTRNGAIAVMDPFSLRELDFEHSYCKQFEIL